MIAANDNLELTVEDCERMLITMAQVIVSFPQYTPIFERCERELEQAIQRAAGMTAAQKRAHALLAA